MRQDKTICCFQLGISRLLDLKRYGMDGLAKLIINNGIVV